MMKSVKIFEESNYYEILSVPVHAGPSEIKRAYRKALDIYDGDSLVTYSLFSEARRKDVLQAIEAAFATLRESRRRAGYNQMLIDTGQANRKYFSVADQKRMVCLRYASSRIRIRRLRRWVAQKTADPAIRKHKMDLLDKELVSGPELKRYRQAMGVELCDIYEVTKISTGVLKAMESNHFKALPAIFYLKRFLSAYAHILMLDPQRIVKGYLKQFNGAG